LNVKITEAPKRFGIEMLDESEDNAIINQLNRSTLSLLDHISNKLPKTQREEKPKKQVSPSPIEQRNISIISLENQFTLNPIVGLARRDVARKKPSVVKSVPR
jgi:hypothetical protein